MASVIRAARSEERIDRSLDYLLGEWAAIPRVASDWASWDEAERLDFVMEWPVREDRLHEVERWAADVRLTASQRRQYADLQVPIAEHNPTLGRLLRE